MKKYWAGLLLGLSSLLIVPQSAEGDYELLVMVDRYMNENHRDEGGCCDFNFFGHCKGNCDNYFLFCLRPRDFSRLDLSCPNGQLETGEVGGDDLSFFERVGSLSNPVMFPVRGSWSGSFQLRIDVHDSDVFQDDFVDEIFAQPVSFSPGDSFTSSSWYTGIGRRSQIQLRFRVRCSDNFFGPDCNTLCINNERYSCNTNGTRSCNEGFFNLPECLTQCAPTEHSLCDLTGNVVCREDYFTEDCSVFCRASQSEETGFYSCDPLTGEKVCLSGYTDPATNCTVLVTTTQQPTTSTTEVATTEAETQHNSLSTTELGDIQFQAIDLDTSTENSNKDQLIAIVTVMTVVVIVLAIAMVIAVKVAFRLAKKKDNVSRDINKSLIENGPVDNIYSSKDGGSDESVGVQSESAHAQSQFTTTGEWDFSNPLYADVGAPNLHAEANQMQTQGTRDIVNVATDSVNEADLYSSVRSKIFVHVTHH